jgi:hypothetical protein
MNGAPSSVAVRAEVNAAISPKRCAPVEMTMLLVEFANGVR